MPRRDRELEATFDSIFTIQSGITQESLNNILNTAKRVGGKATFTSGSRGLVGFARFDSQEDLEEFENVISPNPRVIINTVIISDPTGVSQSRSSSINFALDSLESLDSIEILANELNGNLNIETSEDKTRAFGIIEFDRKQELDEFKSRVSRLSSIKLLKVTEIRGEN